MQEIKSLICTKCEGKIENYNGRYICSGCGKVYDYTNTLEKNEDKQSELWKKKEKVIINTIITTCILIICALVAWRINTPLNNKSNQGVGQNNYANDTTMSQQHQQEKESTEVAELPDSLFFMTNLDPVKNNDGTYSFDGRFTKCSTNYYSSDITVYIESVNGRSFSTSAPEFRHAMYLRNSGEYGTVAADLMYEPYQLSNIYFRFTYDEDGELVDFTQLY